MYPQVPLAWALRAAGHEVRVAGQPDAVDDIVHAGLTAVPVGEDLDQEGMVEEFRERHEADPEGTDPLGENELLRMDELRPEKLTYDHMHGVFSAMTPTVFQTYAADRMVDDLVAFAREWRPDLVVRETLTFAGAIAARACGAAHARLMFGLDLLGAMRQRYLRAMRERPPELREDPIAEWLSPTLDRYGCEFTEDLVLGHWTIDPVPTWARLPVDHHYIPVRAVPYNGPSVVPGWLREPPKRPRVCLTLGVSFREVMGGDQAPIDTLLEAVADLDIEVVATLDARQLGSVRQVPDNVRVADFVPLNELLPSCSAIIHQAGTGTWQNALAHGVPQIIIPTDIWCNVIKAEKTEATGAALRVPDPGRLTAAELRSMLLRVLEDPSFSRNAARLRTDWLGTPAPRDIVPVLERLTVEYRTPDGAGRESRRD